MRARTDPLVVDPPFRSMQAALESDAVAAINETESAVAAFPKTSPQPVRRPRASARQQMLIAR